MMTTVYGAYPISLIPESTHIEHVAATQPYRKWEKERDRDKDKEKNKKRKHDQEGQTKEQKENVPGQIGCFFEAKA